MYNSQNMQKDIASKRIFYWKRIYVRKSREKKFLEKKPGNKNFGSEEKKNLELWIMHFHLLEDFFSEDFLIKGLFFHRTF